MNQRVLVVGGPPESRRRMAATLDAAFDMQVETANGPLEAMRRLPNAAFGLFFVLAEAAGDEAPGIDLIRFLSRHALHARTPTAFVGGTEAERAEARGLGALLLDAAITEADVRALAQDVLGLG